MIITKLKKSIHKKIDLIEDEEFLKGLYILLKDKAARSEYSLTPEQIKIIKDREKEYKRGETKTYTWEEAKKEIRKRAASKN